jgi:hypothetical protein
MTLRRTINQRHVTDTELAGVPASAGADDAPTRRWCEETVVHVRSQDVLSRRIPSSSNSRHQRAPTAPFLGGS